MAILRNQNKILIFEDFSLIVSFSLFRLSCILCVHSDSQEGQDARYHPQTGSYYVDRQGVRMNAAGFGVVVNCHSNHRAYSCKHTKIHFFK